MMPLTMVVEFLHSWWEIALKAEKVVSGNVQESWSFDFPLECSSHLAAPIRSKKHSKTKWIPRLVGIEIDCYREGRWINEYQVQKKGSGQEYGSLSR